MQRCLYSCVLCLILIMNKNNYILILLLFLNYHLNSQSISWKGKGNPQNLTINGLVFNHDGNKILSGTNCHPASIRMFNVTDGQMLWDYQVGQSFMCIMGVSFSSNNQYIAAIEEFGNLLIFDNSGALPVVVDTLKSGTTYGFATAISPDNQHVAVACSNGKIKIFQLSNGNLELDIAAHNNWVTTLTYSSDGNYLVSGGDDNKVKIWSKSGTLLFTCNGHVGDIKQVRISNDNKIVVSSSDDKKIKIWNLSDGQLIRTISGHKMSVSCIDISPDGSKIVSGSQDSSCKIWDLKTGSLLSTFTDKEGGAVTSIAWSSNGSKIATGSINSDLLMWDIPETLKLNNDNSNAKIQLFPNPCSDFMHVSNVYGETDIKIYNSIFMKVFSASYSDSNLNLDLSAFENGVYTIVLKNNGVDIVKKIIILHE